MKLCFIWICVCILKLIMAKILNEFNVCLGNVDKSQGYTKIKKI